MGHIPLVRPTSKEAACAFCGFAFDRPKDLVDGVPREMPVGRCSNCGAVYVFDITGHNLGAAFSEALVLACDMDWDLAWDLLPEEDYLHKIVEGYDLETHRLYPEKLMQGRTVRGALCFLRLQQEIQEIKGQGVAKRIAGGTVEGAAEGTEGSTTVGTKRKVTMRPARPAPDPQTARKLSKAEVENCIREYRLEPVAAAALVDKKVGRYVQRLLHSNDEIIRLRASEALGRTVEVLAPIDPTSAVAILQGLFAPFATSSASYWGSVDAIGEIIAAAPDLFGGYLPRLRPLMEDDALRPVVLRAFARVAEERPDLVQKFVRRLKPHLDSANPETRGNAVRVFGYIGPNAVRERLMEIQDDREHVRVYEGGNVVDKSIGELARAALGAEQ